MYTGYTTTTPPSPRSQAPDVSSALLQEQNCPTPAGSRLGDFAHLLLLLKTAIFATTATASYLPAPSICLPLLADVHITPDVSLELVKCLRSL